MPKSMKLNQALACFKSKIRVSILNLLLESHEGLHFNEIADKLSIIPSTLEYHLKHLVKLNLITHFNNIYTQNAYSKLVWNIYESYSKLNPIIPYLKTHKMPINESDLLLKFVNANPIFVPDLISMLDLMKDFNKAKISKFMIAGAFNLELEEKLMRFNSDDIRMKELEIISTYENYKKLLEYENSDFFFSLTNIADMKLFLVDRCDLYLGIGKSLKESFGILFLPDLSEKLDFQQALLFRGENNISWLKEKFEGLKKQAKRINLTEGFLKDRSLFIKYLKELSNDHEYNT